jgi:hypothetical protein
VEISADGMVHLRASVAFVMARSAHVPSYRARWSLHVSRPRRAVRVEGTSTRGNLGNGKPGMSCGLQGIRPLSERRRGRGCTSMVVIRLI